MLSFIQTSRYNHVWASLDMQRLRRKLNCHLPGTYGPTNNGAFYLNCLLLLGKEEYTNDNDDTDDSFKDNWIQGQTLASINVGNMEFKILVKTLGMKNSFWNYKQWSDSRPSAVIESENRKTGLQFVVKRRAGHIVRIQNPKVEILLNVCIVFISEKTCPSKTLHEKACFYTMFIISVGRLQMLFAFIQG